MKTIGLIGGMSWLSTIDYYRLLNEMVNERLGGTEAGKIIIYSVNFGEIKILTEEDRWNEIAKLICNAAKKLEAAGADCILIGANTMYKIAGEVQEELGIPASTLSHHLEKLKQVGLVHVRRESTYLWYSADTDALREVMNFLYEECCTRSRAVPAESIVQISR